MSPSSFLPIDAPPAPAPAHCAGFGRATIIGHVDRWLASPHPATGDRAVLGVLDVDLDLALPVGDAEEHTRRLRLARYVERALRDGIDDHDVVARIDWGRFAVLRTGLAGACAATETTTTARRVEVALARRLEGHGVRLTCGGATLVRGGTSDGRRALAAVTGAMLAGKLFSDDRVVVVVAPGG